MKALLIGGTGTISGSISDLLVREGWEVTLLNRGNQTANVPQGIRILTCDINDENTVDTLLGEETFDVAADFIAYQARHLERDYRLFRNRARQFIFISSASAYQKPPSSAIINESTPLSNPFWQYSRDKIDCESFLMDLYRSKGFPVTIIRPSHTYDHRKVPVAVHGENGSWQVLKRMIDGKPVIIPGDGTSLWTVTHARDFAKGFVGLMGNIHAIGEAVQITSDESTTWNQLHSIMADTLGVQLKTAYVPSTFLSNCGDYDFTGNLLGDKAHTVIFDNTKLKRLVPGFQAVIRADQGLAETVRYVASHPECQQEDPKFDAWCDKVVAALEQAKKSISI